MDESKSYLEKAKTYEKIKQKLALVHLVLTPLLLLLLMLSPISSYFKQSAEFLAANRYFALVFYFTFVSGYFLIFDFPFSFYSGFILEHRFGLSNQTFGAWGVFFLKRAVLSFMLSLALVEMLYALIWHYPSHWWVCAWAGYALVSYVLGKVFPLWIVPLFYKYGRVDDENLKGRIIRLTQRYGLSVENVYSLDLSKTTKKANAAFMGMGRTKRVVLSDTLIDQFTQEEIETVVAHELGHFKHHDIWKLLGFGLAASFFAFWIAFLSMEPFAEILRIQGAQDIMSLPLLFFVFYLFSLVLSPAQSGFSRWLERAADRFALEAVSQVPVFISCMTKLGRVNLADPDPNPVYEWFFYDHPSLGKRVRMAQAWSQEERSS